MIPKIKQLGIMQLAEPFFEKKGIVDREEKEKYYELAVEYYAEVKKNILLGLAYKFTANWGLIGIIPYKIRAKKIIDWPASKEKGTYVFKENNQPISFRFHWDKKIRILKNRISNLSWYKISTVQKFKHEMFNYITEMNEDPYRPNYSVPRTL